MEPALYLLPVTLGDTTIEKVLPSYNKEIILGIRPECLYDAPDYVANNPDAVIDTVVDVTELMGAEI